MTEHNTNWFAMMEKQLPSPDKLVAFSQTLIETNLPAAFNMANPYSPANAHIHPPPPPTPSAHRPSGSHRTARKPERPRLAWTPQLHQRFVDAVKKLGMKSAVPRNIVKMMNVDGLTRPQVASHLQKYRLFLKQNQGASRGNGDSSSGGATNPVLPPRLQPAWPLAPPEPVMGRHLEFGDRSGERKTLALFPSGSNR